MAVVWNNLQTTWWEFFIGRPRILQRYSNESLQHQKSNHWTEKRQCTVQK